MNIIYFFCILINILDIFTQNLIFYVVMHVELYKEDESLIAERTKNISAAEIEHRIIFTEDEMADASYAKIYVEENGNAVSTEDEIIDLSDSGEIPVVGDIRIVYYNGTVSFSGNADLKSGAVLVRAVYDSEGRLVNTEIYSVSDIKDKITVIGDSSDGIVKYMLWDSFKKMHPLAEAVEE